MVYHEHLEELGWTNGVTYFIELFDTSIITMEIFRLKILRCNLCACCSFLMIFLSCTIGSNDSYICLNYVGCEGGEIWQRSCDEVFSFGIYLGLCLTVLSNIVAVSFFVLFNFKLCDYYHTNTRVIVTEELKINIHINFHFVFSQLIRRRYFADAVPAPSPWSLASQRPRQHSTDILIDDDPLHPSTRCVSLICAPVSVFIIECWWLRDFQIMCIVVVCDIFKGSLDL